VTAAQWRLRSGVEELLAAHIGLTDIDLAALLGVTMAELVPVLRVMYRQRRTDFCWGFIVLTPRGDEGRRAA
jgi:hypothetical protein